MNYIDKAELKREILASQAAGQATERFAVLCYTLADRVLNFPQFRNYPIDIKEEMKQYSVARLCTRGFVTAKADGNLFAYLTSAMYTNYIGFLSRWYAKQNKQRAIKLAILDRIANPSEIIQREVEILQHWDERRGTFSDTKLEEPQ